MAVTGKKLRIWVTGDDGQEHEITDQVKDEFKLTIQAVPHATAAYERFLRSIKPIKITARFQPAYRWLGEVLARAFSFSKN